MTMSIRMSLKQLQHGIVLEGYCRTECGTVPRDWTKFYLGDIYTERNEPGNENLPLLMVSIHSGVSDGEVDEEQLTKKFKRIEDKTQYKRAESGDLVFNMMRAWQGAVGTVRTRGMVSPAYIVAKPGDMVDPLFMNFYMRTDRMIKSIHRQSYGVTDFRLRLYWDSFAAIPCVLPPLSEQRKIAAILVTQDKVIELYEHKIEQLQLLKKNCLRKMFPRHGNDTPEVRFRGFTGTWERKRLGELFTGYAEKGRPELPALTTIQGGGTVLRDESDRKRQYDRHSLSNYKVANKGDFIVHLRSFEGGLEIVTTPGLISPAYHVFHGKKIDPRFYYAYFRSVDFIECDLKPHVYGIRDGRSIDIEGMKTIMIPHVSLKEQQAIGNCIESFDRLIALNQRKCDEEKQKKKALMQVLLTGIVRVGEAASCRLERAGKEAAGSRFSTRIAKV